MSDICRYCKRPERAHCKGCGACWPDHTCRIDCDINEADDGGAYDERTFERTSCWNA